MVQVLPRQRNLGWRRAAHSRSTQAISIGSLWTFLSGFRIWPESGAKSLHRRVVVVPWLQHSYAAPRRSLHLQFGPGRASLLRPRSARSALRRADEQPRYVARAIVRWRSPRLFLPTRGRVVRGPGQLEVVRSLFAPIQRSSQRNATPHLDAGCPRGATVRPAGLTPFPRLASRKT